MKTKASRASIDLGTNTCLLLILSEAGEVIEDSSTIVRLGEGVDATSDLSEEAMRRTQNCLRNYANRIDDEGLLAQETVCVATAQARDAQNGKEFFDLIRDELGFEFRVLSGQEEAEFSFRGALLPQMNRDQVAVIDIGGGSTELISSAGGKSLQVGAVRFTERYLSSDPVTDEEFWKCQEMIDQELHGMKEWRSSLPQGTVLLGVAGTIVNLGAWFGGLELYEPQKLEAIELTRGDVHRQVEELKWRTIGERTELVGVERQRADVLLAGAMILWRTMEVLEFPTCRISTRGLRYGVLLLEEMPIQ